MKLNRQKILDFFKKSESKASVLLKDKSKASDTIKEALGKAVTNKGELEGVWTKMVLLFAVAKDYVNGDYTEIPKRSIMAILGGLIYFLSPIDVVPDFVPVLGFIDDVFVLNLVYKQVLKDLQKYKIWKDAQINLIEDADAREI
ncbi:YkvA family protein [Pedobacter sp. Leaf176]|uniref:YkvA family protein n=1 Tax=Pedobacter sp. Leaf176 TaxID=1736286 RepID=UPI0006FABADC|nr:YkvA family protein [Pedobacter sp. Leaf176]KQR72524.1 methyltransferase type 11 [Pedobacter sp. Leaf176]